METCERRLQVQLDSDAAGYPPAFPLSHCASQLPFDLLPVFWYLIVRSLSSSRGLGARLLLQSVFTVSCLRVSALGNCSYFVLMGLVIELCIFMVGFLHFLLVNE